MERYDVGAMAWKEFAVLADVTNEMERQLKLKAEGRFPYTARDPELSPLAKCAVLVEEVGEVARAVLEAGELVNDTHHVNLRKELIQVAAVALAWVEGLDGVRR